MFNQTTNERFWAKVDTSSGADGCWEWTSRIKPCGYPYLWVGNDHQPREMRANRLAYELLVGPIPDGLHIDHLCENKRCVNPAHLEAVTNRENVLRASRGACATNKVKTHCKHGHPFDAENTYIRKDDGTRMCRRCRTDRMRRYNQQKAAA